MKKIERNCKCQSQSQSAFDLNGKRLVPLVANSTIPVNSWPPSHPLPVRLLQLRPGLCPGYNSRQDIVSSSGGSQQNFLLIFHFLLKASIKILFTCICQPFVVVAASFCFCCLFFNMHTHAYLI